MSDATKGESTVHKGKNDTSLAESPTETTAIKTDARNNKRKVHQLSLDADDKNDPFTAQLARRGVVYLAHIPPRLNPAKVKQLLSQHGTVTRVYLQPADSKRHQQRYTEGWIEFADRKVARRVAAALHQTPMAKKSGDLWNLKYLKHFRWDLLTEKVAYERRVREQKLRLETMQARKEANYYKHKLETNQKLDYIEQRRKRKQSSEENKADESKKRRQLGRQLKTLDEGANQSTGKEFLGSLL